MVCNTFFETECNTTDIVPEPGFEPTPVTYCDKVGERKVSVYIITLPVL